MDDSSGIDQNVARAIAAAIDWNSSPETRKAALAYLDSIKNGDIRVLACTSFVLVKKDKSLEIRLHGFKMLQHLVRLRWDEFDIVERRDFANAAMNLITEMVDPREDWALKSQTAALVAEVVRREGLCLWQELLPSLTSIAVRGPIEGELVAMLLRWLPEDITVHNEDLEGDRRRELLRGLTQSLPEILPLLYTLLERHFGAALDNARNQNIDMAKIHAATVTATMNAINAYAEWAPVADFAKFGLIEGCGFMLSSFEFRLHACEIFKILSQRKRPLDESASEFDCAIKSIILKLINVSADFLQRSSLNASGIDEIEFEFIECICETMVYVGTSGLHYVDKDGSILSLYIQQMLGYLQHFKLSIHFQSLNFWLLIMRESASKAKLTSQASGESLGDGISSTGSADHEKKLIMKLITDDICSAILDISFQRLLKKPVSHGCVSPPGTLELWSDDFDGKCDFSQYRSRLLDLIRLVSTHEPVVSVATIYQKINLIIQNGSKDSASSQVLPLLESLQLGLETVISAVSDGPLESDNISPEAKFGMCRILQGLLQEILSVSWKEPTLAVLLARYLDAFGPYLKSFPDSVSAVINKLFDLLTSLPCILKDPSANNARQARLQICASFIRIAKAADKSLLPHMRGIADTMSLLEGQGCLLRGERNLLSEAFLLMASSAGTQQHQEILAWLLEPLSKQWTQLDWQNTFLSDSLGIARLCSDTQFMWSIFHSVTFFEKALKRSGMKKHSANVSTMIESSASSPINPMASHLSWMLPPLLKILRGIHALWSDQMIPTLPPELRAAMSMSHVEHASLLGEGVLKTAKVPLSDSSYSDENTDGHMESVENDLRNWLKGIRDSGYNVLGMSATIGECFFRCISSDDVSVALTENIKYMEFRHLRQLVHLTIIPITKFCPTDLWDLWIEKILHPLLAHCQQSLSHSWSNLLHEGKANVPDMFGNLAGLDLKVEVMEDKLLRALTREICALLSVAASPSLNNGLHSLDQLGSVYRVDSALLKNLDAFALNSLACFFLVHKGLALPALQITLQTFSWTDGESVNKVVSFCGVVILLAVSSNNVELREFVAKDLFFAIIQSLTLESNAIVSHELVGLCREIFFYLSNRDPSPRQVLLSISGISLSDLIAFEDALGKTSSPREQKQHMRSLLMLATKNKFKALAAQRTTNVITNVSIKQRGISVSGYDNQDEVIGLAAIT